MEESHSSISNQPRCTSCGKAILPKGRYGTMTWWIFRATYCACESPQYPLTQPISALLQRAPELREITGLPMTECKSCLVTHCGNWHECEPESGSGPTQDEQSLVGTTIKEKYLVLGYVGRGGMSVVYRAQHIHLQHDVALKLLRSHLIFDDDMFMRFSIEAKAVSALTHKNIIRLFDYGITDDARPYLAVEFLTGTSLEEIIRSCGVVEESVAVNWFCQIVSALDEAHSRDIVHRDLKPSNVMVGTDGSGIEIVKLLDFGIAKVLSEDTEQARLTQTGEVFGSPMYMSPEQCLGKQLDGRADIYAVGILMYEVLSGKAPILGLNVLDTLRRQLSSNARPLKEVAPYVSDDLCYIVMRCLEKEPDDRYATASALLADLTALKNRKRLRRISQKNKKERKPAFTDSSRIFTVIIALLCLCLFAAAALAGFKVMPKLATKVNLSNVPQQKPTTSSGSINNTEYKKIRDLAAEYTSKGKFKEATPLLLFCVEVLKDQTDRELELADIHRELGNCFLKTGAESEARQNLIAANRLYEKHNFFPKDKQAFLLECAGAIKNSEFTLP